MKILFKFANEEIKKKSKNVNKIDLLFKKHKIKTTEKNH